MALTEPETQEEPALEICLAGRVEVLRDGEPLDLPQSRKTLALLAYLAVTGRRHTREHLAGLLWDVADDPRAALRWSLSKLRPLADGATRKRILADRDGVALDTAGICVDVVDICALSRGPLAAIDDATLDAALARIRGDFLAGLDQPDLMGFHAWCIAQREELRIAHVRLLEEIISRRRHAPAECLDAARELVRIDPDSEEAWATLASALNDAGRRDEAARQIELARRHFGPDARLELLDLAVGEGWRPAEIAQPMRSEAGARERFSVGRHEETARLAASLDAAAGGAGRIVVITGEPGVGKTHLLESLAALAHRRGGTILWGGAFEAEAARPYGPWIDALARARNSGADGPANDALAVEIDSFAGGGDRSREHMFDAITAALSRRASAHPPLVLIFDDVHWCDEASVSLLHFVVRNCQRCPILFALSARGGELTENTPMLRLVRQLRRSELCDEIALEPLDRDSVTALVRSIAPDLDAARIFEATEGNALFALEFARSWRGPETDVPGSLADIVLDRAERLPSTAGDILRWAAVLGRRFTIGEIERLENADPQAVAEAIDLLERYALIRPAGDGKSGAASYDFSHDLVRRVIYGAISEPRRRRMHLHVALAIQKHETTNPAAAADIASHAALAGEPAVAARACIDAGQWCLRLFANAEALQFAQRGIAFAEALDQPEQVKLLIELVRISFAAQRPDEPETAARRLSMLAETALDHGAFEHARRGFEALSYLRWEIGDWSSALQNTMKAERVSRSASLPEHILAMSETARCLVLLEHDLPGAEAMLMEAQALAERAGVDPQAIPHGTGMLNFYRGDYEAAKKEFEKALLIARRDGERISEFMALEHLVLLDLATRRYGRALDDARELVELGDRIREGSEAPIATALYLLCRAAAGEAVAVGEIDDALERVRAADAKQRLANALCFAAEIDLAHGECARAVVRSDAALEVANAIGRASEIAFARAMRGHAAWRTGDAATATAHRDEIFDMMSGGVSAFVRERAEALDALLDDRQAYPGGGG